MAEGARRLGVEKKHHEHFISPPVTPYGRPNKIIRIIKTTLEDYTAKDFVCARQAYSIRKVLENLFWDEMSSVCCVAFAGMVCDLDKTSGRSCILLSPPLADTFIWTCMLIQYHLSSDDVKFTLDLLADNDTILTYTFFGKESAKWIENPHHGSSISVKFTASLCLP